MRQQVKQEKPTETTYISPLVTPETNTSVHPTLTEQATTTTQPVTHKWHGWPFLAIGVFLIVFAGITFFLSLDFLKASPETTLSVDQTLGTNSLTEFYDIFFSLLMNLVVATIYILYGLWLRKQGGSGQLPPFLSLYTKGFQKSQNLAFASWGLRFFVVVMAFLLTYSSLMELQSRTTLPMIMSLVNSTINTLGICGLLLILASAIYPLRARKKPE